MRQTLSALNEVRREIFGKLVGVFHEASTDTRLPNWVRSTFGHFGEFCDLCAGTLTFSELRAMYREAREYDQHRMKQAAFLGLTYAG